MTYMVIHYDMYGDSLLHVWWHFQTWTDQTIVSHPSMWSTEIYRWPAANLRSKPGVVPHLSSCLVDPVVCPMWVANFTVSFVDFDGDPVCLNAWQVPQGVRTHREYIKCNCRDKVREEQDFVGMKHPFRSLHNKDLPIAFIWYSCIPSSTQTG